MELDTNNMYTQQNPNWVIMTNTLTVVLKNSMNIMWCILPYLCLHYSVNNNSICIVVVTLHAYLNRSACFCKLLGPVAKDSSTVSENVGQCSSFSRLFSLWATFNCNKNTCIIIIIGTYTHSHTDRIIILLKCLVEGMRK